MPISYLQIGHLIFAVRDLKVAAEFYWHLRVRVGQRNRHP